MKKKLAPFPILKDEIRATLGPDYTFIELIEAFDDYGIVKITDVLNGIGAYI